MATNTDKKTERTIKKIVTASLAVLFVILIIALIINLVRLGAANDRKDKLAEKKAQLTRMIEESNGRLDYCTSTDFIVKYAREYLDMVYRDETVAESK